MTPPLSRVLAPVVLFVLGLGLGVAAIRSWAPAPPPPLLAERLAEFDVDRDSYDTLFFGSSRIFRSVDPNVFDAATARRGHPTRSFNLAFPGMVSHETNAWMRSVLADPPENLRYVLIELDQWPIEIHDRLEIETSIRTGRYTARAVAWHDAPETLSVLHSTWISNEVTKTRLQLAATHLSHWAVRTFGIGNLAQSLRQWMSAADETHEPPRTGRRGFTPYEPADFQGGFPFLFRSEFLQSLDTYHAAVNGLREANRQPVDLDTYNLRALEEQIRRVRATGATLIYLLPPRGEATPQLVRLGEDGYVEDLLDFGRPDLHPELFELEHRFDSHHLSPSGALIFSRVLGEEFARGLEER